MPKIIDGHMHLTQWFSNSEKPYYKVLADYCNSMGLDGVVDMCCSDNNVLYSGFEADQVIIGAIAKNEVPQTYVCGCMMMPNLLLPQVNPKDYPHEFDFTYQLEMLQAMGIDGIKFCEFKPDSFKANKMPERLAEFEPYFAFCEEHGIPMCWHVADPDIFWDPKLVTETAVKNGWFYEDASYPTYDELYRLTYQILDSHPKLRVTLAHAFFIAEKPELMISVFEKYPNVKIDLAPAWILFEGFEHHYEEWYRIFHRYSDRILFGTDAEIAGDYSHGSLLVKNELRFLQTDDSFDTPDRYFTRGIALEGNDLANVLYNNAQTTFGERPKQLDRAVFKEYCKTYLPYIPESVNKHEIEKYIRKNMA